MLRFIQACIIKWRYKHGTEQYDSSALRQKSKCKQPKVSKATVCSVLYVRAKGHGWMEQRDKTGDVRDRIKGNSLRTLNRFAKRNQV